MGRRGEENTDIMEPKTETRAPRRRYEETFKGDCAALLEKGGKSLKAFAGEMGISHWNLRDWRRLYRTPVPPRSPEAVEAELAEAALGSHVPTDEGWLCVAGVLGLCSRRIVGLASAGHLETSLPEAALRQAIPGRKLPPGGLVPPQ